MGGGGRPPAHRAEKECVWRLRLRALPPAAWPLSLLLCCVILVAVSAGCTAVDHKQTDLERADGLRAVGRFTEAAPLYSALLQDVGSSPADLEIAAACRTGLSDMELLSAVYALTEDDAREALAEAFPQVPEAERESWLTGGSLEHISIDGTPHYFYGVADNVRYRDMNLMHQDADMPALHLALVKGVVGNIATVAQPDPWWPYSFPNSYRGVGTLAVPREVLPETGTLKIWFPLPLTLGFQQPVEIESIEPVAYLKTPPQISGDIGVAYMEVPLAELADDLDVRIEFTFTHYEQHFAVDPSRVGAYDTSDPEYVRYTGSYGNTTITEDIRRTARAVVGDEHNPYLAAKKIYDYMEEHILYSYMPHHAFWPRSDMRESVYVHEHGYGDCGAQGMYFSALCRAVGIPARCTGGWQLMGGTFGSHFWAEFLVPGYGWIPVDTNAGQMHTFTPDATDEQRRIYSDFYFGNQDAFRCVVQKDVDVPFVPVAEELTSLPPALQEPQALCETMEGCPSLVLLPYWKLEATVLEESHSLGLGT